MASARSKSVASSVRQKYSLRKSSCMQMICAPRFATSRILSMAGARFSFAPFVQRIGIKPAVNLSGMTRIVAREQQKHSVKSQERGGNIGRTPQENQKL